MDKLVFFITVFWLLTSCATNTVTRPCVFPDSISQKAPAWICDVNAKGYSLAAVGMSEKSLAGLQFMKEMAVVSARVTLAQRLQVRVQNMMQQYVSSKGMEINEVVYKAYNSVTRLITDSVLIGSKLVEFTTSDTGTIYALVAIDDKDLQKVARNALNASMKSDQALWQDFNSNMPEYVAQADLAQAIASTKLDK